MCRLIVKKVKKGLAVRCYHVCPDSCYPNWIAVQYGQDNPYAYNIMGNINEDDFYALAKRYNWSISTPTLNQGYIQITDKHQAHFLTWEGLCPNSYDLYLAYMEGLLRKTIPKNATIAVTPAECEMVKTFADKHGIPIKQKRTVAVLMHAASHVEAVFETVADAENYVRTKSPCVTTTRIGDILRVEAENGITMYIREVPFNNDYEPPV